MTPPVFYLLAGPNGAGKSTLYRAAVAEGLIPADIEFVNADLFEAAELAQVVDPKAHSEQARLWADQRRTTLLSAGRSFVSESKVPCAWPIWPCSTTPRAPPSSRHGW